MVELVDQADARGLAISPSLPEGCKNYLIDIDGTVCEDIPNEQPERMEDAEVFPDVVKIINGWYDKGHVITFFTSRTANLRMSPSAGWTPTASATTPWSTTNRGGGITTGWTITPCARRASTPSSHSS